MNKTLRNMALVALAAAPFSAFAEIAGSGTAEDPYVIATAEDLANAYKVTAATGTTYFRQTADIDMDGVETYHPVAGGNGAYTSIINYDGGNHLIKNFAPAEPEAVETSEYNYYSTSVFGVPSGVIANLGIVDAYSSSALQGTGILGAYGGHANGSALTVENVFVTGEVYGESSYTGALFGTTGNDVTIVNSFAIATVNGGANTAGLIGRLRNTLYLEQVYAAVPDVDYIIAASDRTNIAVQALDVFAFGTGEAVNAGCALDGDIEVVEAGNVDAIKAIKEWDGFSETLVIEGYPLLEGFDLGSTTGVFDAAVEAEANGPAVYYNLQGVQVANPDNGIYIVRRGDKVSKELIRK